MGEGGNGEFLRRKDWEGEESGRNFSKNNEKLRKYEVRCNRYYEREGEGIFEGGLEIRGDQNLDVRGPLEVSGKEARLTMEA